MKYTIDERLDKYADFAFDIGTLVKAYHDATDLSIKAKAFDKMVEHWKDFAKEVQSWVGN